MAKLVVWTVDAYFSSIERRRQICNGGTGLASLMGGRTRAAAAFCQLFILAPGSPIEKRALAVKLNWEST
jgi:hypothetical protein